MRNFTLRIFAVVFVAACAAQFAAAQFEIKLPKIKKPKGEPTKPDAPPKGDNGAPVGGKTGGKNIYQNQLPTSVPVLLKNSIYLKTVTHHEYWKIKGQRNFSSWVPAFRVGLFYNDEETLNYKVEYYNPDGSLWLSEDLECGRPSAERVVSCASPSPWGEILNTKSTNATGIYSFKLTNQTTKQVDYQGKFKVGKYSASSDGRDKNKFDFYVDHDWLLPFGMIGFHHSDIEIGGIEPEVSVWLNGMVTADELEARLFYQGRQIATTKERGGTVSDYDERASQFAPPFAPHTIWKRWLFTWKNFLFDNNGSFNRDSYPNAHYADKNPGDYTVKIYRNGTQIREMNFTVGADGKFAAPAYMNQTFLPYHRILLPVKTIGAAEKVNPTAWKTDAFYGNPLSGFNAP